MSDPYADAADQYWQAGWRGILPLPLAKKHNPPPGFTGATGTDPTYPDLYAWADGTDGPHNICLRLPANIIGIDVDAYGDKLGAHTLTTREQQWGPLPPTWRTTSRDDGISGIRLYRIPEGLAWPGVVGPGIETVRRDHRYAVCWPSIHPEGGTYRWINPDGIVTAGGIPDPDQLPALPHEWIMGLTGGEAAAEVNRHNLAEDAAMLWIANLHDATGDECRRMRTATDRTIADLPTGAHDAATAGAARILRYGDEHHHGTVTALTRLRTAFRHETTNPARTIAGKTLRTPAEAENEWRSIVRSAVNLIAANPSGVDTCDCDGHLTHTILDAAASDTTDTPSGSGTPTGHEQLTDGATFILDAPDTPPAIWGWDSEVLWSEGESLMIAGPPGVGKTTLTGQLLRARLGLQDDLLGWGVTPTGRSVLYLAMDRPAQIARSLRRHFNEPDRDTLAAKLRVWSGPPPADVATNPHLLHALAQLADADTIIIDSVKDAAIGLTEDETAAGYNRARQYALARNVEIVELHHLVKRGPNGAAPRQLADVYGSAWLTAGAGSVILLWGQAGDPVVQLTHLKQPAEDVGPLIIIHDHTTGISTIDTETADLPALLAANTRGLSAKAAAVHLFGTDDPTRSQTEKARRRLDSLVKAGLASLQPGAVGGNKKAPALYFPTSEAIHEPIHATPDDTPGIDPFTGHSRPFTDGDVYAGQSHSRAIHAIHAEADTSSHSRVPPPLRGDARDWPVNDTPSGLLHTCQEHDVDYVTNCPHCQAAT